MKAKCSMIDVLLKINDAVFAVDNNFAFTYANQAFCDAVGFKAEGLLGKNLWETLPKIVGTIVYKQMIQAMEDKEVKVFEWQGVYNPKRDWETTIYPTENGLTAITKDITKRKKTEEALRESEQRFRTVFEKSALGIAIGDVDGHVAMSNSAFEHIVGYGKDELKGMSFHEFTYYEDLEKEVPLLKEVVEGKRDSYDIEKRYVRKDGKLVWVHVTGSAVRNQNNVPVMSIGTVKDITSYKEAEEAVRRSEERFRVALKNSPITLIELDCDLRFKWIYNPLIGQTPEQIVGKKIGETGTVEDITPLREFYNSILKSGEPKRAEIKLGHFDRVAYYDIYAEPMKNECGEIVGVTSASSDITKRKKAEEALKASEERYKSVFLNSLDAILLTIPNGEILSANPAAQRMFGMTEAEIKQTGRAGLVIFDERTALALAERERTGQGRAELTLRRKDRSLFEADVTSNLFTDADGTIKTSMIIRDITERKKVEEALKHQTQQLEHSQKQLEEYANRMEQLAIQRAKQLQEQERIVAIGQTAGMVGHDIRNPLQAIVSELYLEKENVSNLPDSEAKYDTLESINFIQEQVDYINKIVADLQDYARQTKPNISQVNLTKLISDSFAAIGIPSNILPMFHIEPNLDVRTDPDFLRRIITNLVNNAIQAMPSGGKLKIDACKSKGKIQLAVEDTGHGIPDDVKDKLFKPLFTTKSKGQGFGLPVVKKFVEQLGGAITFETQEGKGTIFKIELPIGD